MMVRGGDGPDEERAFVIRNGPASMMRATGARSGRVDAVVPSCEPDLPARETPKRWDEGLGAAPRFQA